MKVFGILLAGFVLPLASAQVVTGIDITGGSSVSAQTYHLVPHIGYTGGSGRGGGGGRHPYTYYTTTIDQSKTGSSSFVLGESQNSLAVCNWYSPSFAARASNSAGYEETGSLATIAFGLMETASALPATSGLNRVSSSASTNAKVYFSVPNDTTLKISLGGNLANSANYTLGTTSTDGDQVIFYVSPGVYTLTGGFGYYLSLDPISLAGATGASQSGKLGVQLDFAVVSNGGGG